MINSNPNKFIRELLRNTKEVLIELNTPIKFQDNEEARIIEVMDYCPQILEDYIREELKYDGYRHASICEGSYNKKKNN